MKTTGRLARFGLAALFGVTALAVLPRGARAQGQPAPAPPAEAAPDARNPYAPPPNFDPSRVPPQDVAPPQTVLPQEGTPPQAQPGPELPPGQDPQGPRIIEVPDGYESPQLDAPPPYVVPETSEVAPDDVAPDDSIADSYDDGYDPQAYQQFQQALSPYGSWIDDASYGWIWMPAVGVVGADFSPYTTNGHWVLSEFGWTWVSDWSWGWAPFHYGRWTPVAGRGWCWVPGRNWGPAWVSWRSGGGYVGWAPLPPRGLNVMATVGARSPWRFTLATNLGAARPTLVDARFVPGLFGRTSVVANDRLLTRGLYAVHVNAGPVHGTAATPVRLASVAPHALPRVAIYPRTGVSIGERPWVQAMSAPARSSAHPDRGFGAPVRSGTQASAFGARGGTTAGVGAARGVQIGYSTTPSAYRAAESTPRYATQPAAHYATPQPAYHYATPQPSYHYTAPQPSYHYTAPQPAYHYATPAPAPAPAPAPRASYPSAPADHFGYTGGGQPVGGAHFGGASFSGGGSFGGGAHFGGGRRR